MLTDGANTYYTPQSLGYSDPADNESIYSDYGYTGKNYNGGSTTRLYMGTDDNVEKDTFSNDNYTEALNEKMSTLCENAKASKIILMTVSLDLDQNDKTEKTQMDALKACSSESRFPIDPATGKPAKLYWNATGAGLSDDFKAIANELSNLRIVGSPRSRYMNETHTARLSSPRVRDPLVNSRPIDERSFEGICKRPVRAFVSQEGGRNPPP